MGLTSTDKARHANALCQIKTMFLRCKTCVRRSGHDASPHQEATLNLIILENVFHAPGKSVFFAFLTLLDSEIVANILALSCAVNNLGVRWPPSAPRVAPCAILNLYGFVRRGHPALHRGGED